MNQSSVFLGAWYRKVYSSKDSWLGIEGTLRLGEFNQMKTDLAMTIERFGTGI